MEIGSTREMSLSSLDIGMKFVTGDCKVWEVLRVYTSIHDQMVVFAKSNNKTDSIGIFRNGIYNVIVDSTVYTKPVSGVTELVENIEHPILGNPNQVNRNPVYDKGPSSYSFSGGTITSSQMELLRKELPGRNLSDEECFILISDLYLDTSKRQMDWDLVGEKFEEYLQFRLNQYINQCNGSKTRIRNRSYHALLIAFGYSEFATLDNIVVSGQVPVFVFDCSLGRYTIMVGEYK